MELTFTFSTFSLFLKKCTGECHASSTKGKTDDITKLTLTAFSFPKPNLIDLWDTRWWAMTTCWRHIMITMCSTIYHLSLGNSTDLCSACQKVSDVQKIKEQLRLLPIWSSNEPGDPRLAITETLNWPSVCFAWSGATKRIISSS